MEASLEEIQTYINKGGKNETGEAKTTRAKKIINDLMRAQQLNEDMQTPAMIALLEEVEKEVKFYGKQVLENITPRMSVDCKCGVKMNIDQIYYHVYLKVWKTLVDFMERWDKKNEDIIKGSRR